MQKKTTLLFGVTLILLGGLFLAGNLLLQPAGSGSLSAFHAWPVFVIGAGLLFCLPPIIFSEQRGLSGLFIPGLPALATGIMLFIANQTGNWQLWVSFWPMEVISMAAGFVLMAIFMRIPWLMIPASIIGFTGFMLQYCTLTGQWAAWAVLWSVEPFAVGLPLLIIGVFKRLEGLKIAGIILCSLAGLAFAAMSSLLATAHWVTRLIGPVIVLLLGILLVVMAVLKIPNLSRKE